MPVLHSGVPRWNSFTKCKDWFINVRDAESHMFYIHCRQICVRVKRQIWSLLFVVNMCAVHVSCDHFAQNVCETNTRKSNTRKDEWMRDSQQGELSRYREWFMIHPSEGEVNGSCWRPWMKCKWWWNEWLLKLTHPPLSTLWTSDELKTLFS